MSENLKPIHPRGPAINVGNATEGNSSTPSGSFLSVHREGLNSFASEPQKSICLLSARIGRNMIVFFATLIRRGISVWTTCPLDRDSEESDVQYGVMSHTIRIEERCTQRDDGVLRRNPGRSCCRREDAKSFHNDGIEVRKCIELFERRRVSRYRADFFP